MIGFFWLFLWWLYCFFNCFLCLALCKIVFQGVRLYNTFIIYINIYLLCLFWLCFWCASLPCFWSSFVPVVVLLFCACFGCGSGRLWLCLWWWCGYLFGFWWWCLWASGGLCFWCAVIGTYKHKKNPQLMRAFAVWLCGFAY